MKRLLVTATALLVAWGFVAQAAGPDDEYLSIYYLIQQGDQAASRADRADAVEAYRRAEAALKRLKKTYPSWQSNVVDFRLKYLTLKLGQLDAPSMLESTQENTSAASADRTSASTLAENEVLQRKLVVLQAQLQQLQENNESLQSKLREALSIRPTAVDPSQLAKAEAQIQQLARENELLKVTLEDTKAKASATAAGQQIAQLRLELDAANKQLAVEAGKANRLARERGDLEERLGRVVTSPKDAGTQRAGRGELEDVQQRLTAQQAVTTQLLRDRNDMQARLAAMETEVANAAALRAENDLLRRQLAEFKAAMPTGGNAELATRLAAAEAQIAALQSERDILQLERAALEGRVTQFLAGGEGGSGRGSDARKLQQLEKQVAELQQELAEANRRLAAQPGTKSGESADALAAQLAEARAQLEVYEAKPVPYTDEELALFRSGPAQLAAADQPARKSSAIPKPPAGSAALIAEAQRHFVRGEFTEAEAQYQQVLLKDDRNVYTLANLAAIQMEEGKMEDAEKNLQRALSIAPNDAYSLQTLGFLKFRQQDYDGALQQLSRAAQLDPSNAEIQNYLGITLSHEGQRAAAETALRKAVQLQPGYSSAHNNLAVVYATQNPPMVELARWHYEKALAGGHPKNPQLEKLFQEKAGHPAP